MSEVVLGMRAMIENSGARRSGTPSNIADAARLVLGAHSTHLSGADLLVDGGAVPSVQSGKAALPGGWGIGP